MYVQKDIQFMQEAIKEACIAYDKDEIPIGAIIVCDNKIIGRGHNLTETLKDVTAHAEMLAITAAANYIGNKYLDQCTLYVTLEPCVMCAGAMFWAQIGRLVYGAPDIKRGYTRINNNLLHPKTNVLKGVLEDDCSDLIIDFFKKKR
ncbi:MAG TPA: nucleoside deaminase [Bacteroidales bacterium]|nr:nucleoside deaminase [Bacteroidales bacterium]